MFALPHRSFHPTATRFFPSSSLGRSYFKSQICQHWHKITDHGRNMLKSLYHAGRKNMWVFIWLWIPLNKTRIKYFKRLFQKWKSRFAFVMFFKMKVNLLQFSLTFMLEMILWIRSQANKVRQLQWLSSENTTKIIL